MSFGSYAQLPKTDLYLAEFTNLSGAPLLKDVKFLNKFNPNGYNNQPGFISYDELYITVGLENAKFTDIYQLNLKTNEYFPFSETESISEFSATQSKQEGKVSCIRIEVDGKDQSLWSYPADRSNTGKRLLPKLTNVGYHTWLNKDSVVLFLVGSPQTLVLANVENDIVEPITDNIGRCIKYDQNNLLYYVHKSTPDIWNLMSYNINNKQKSIICKMPKGKEDYDFLINGKILCGDGSILKMFDPSKDIEWANVANFSSYGINNINRLAIVRDRIVFVNSK